MKLRVDSRLTPTIFFFEQQDCNGITRSDYFPGVALQLFFIFNAVASHPNQHDYAKSITEPLPNLILLFCEKTRCFYHKIPSRFNANHIDKSQIKCACAAMQACAEFHYNVRWLLPIVPGWRVLQLFCKHCSARL